jgi:hypothetical protein
MNCFLVDIHWLKEAFGGEIIETLTLNQQMAPPYLDI